MSDVHGEIGGGNNVHDACDEFRRDVGHYYAERHGESLGEPVLSP